MSNKYNKNYYQLLPIDFELVIVKKYYRILIFYKNLPIYQFFEYFL